MTKVKNDRDEASSNGPSPAPASAICFAYSLLGAILSLKFGRDPSSGGTLLPDMTDDKGLVREVAPTIIVICLFLVSYSLIDVMYVGTVKAKHGIVSKTYPSVVSQPEEVYLAQRVQTNRVEQISGFLIGSISFTIFVNGRVGAVLTLVWAVLRRMYASTYRASVGLPIDKAGVTKYTIPAYFVQNAMLMGTVVQCARALMYMM